MEARIKYGFDTHKLFPSQLTFIVDNETRTLPPEMAFNSGHLLTIICYSILFIVSAIGNISVLVLLWRQLSRSRSRINHMLIHLTIADLLVTFIHMPIEIGWAMTVSWWAGDTACKCLQFFRTFGLYQSSFVLVCIAIDRYNAVLKPLTVSIATKRGRTMVKFSWVLAALCSIPQMVVFEVHTFVDYPWYEQCISIRSLTPGTHELVTYSLFNMLTMYLIPLIIIFYCYGSILKEICKQANEEQGADALRRSTNAFLSKAKTRTFRMTVTLILAFFTCWTPYYIITVWYMVDRSSASNVNNLVQRALFIFACMNSSVNPIVYGVYNLRKRTVTRKRTHESSNTCTTEVKIINQHFKKEDFTRRGSNLSESNVS